MPSWKKLIVSGSDASLNSLNVTQNVTAQSFTGSFSGSIAAPGSTTQIVFNNGGTLSADSGLVYSGSNVGIGISVPTDKFHIVSSAADNQFGRITATNPSASAAWVAQNDSGDNAVYRVFSSAVSGTQMGSALGRSASLLANLGGSGVFLLGTFSNTNFILGTNNTERMRITNAGNVSINTTTSHGKLTVEQPVSETGLVVNSSTASAPTLYLRDAGGAGYSEILANNKLYINASNVGIGTTAPSTKLEVQGDTQIGNDSTTSVSFLLARKNTVQAKVNYSIPSNDSPTYQFIEGGFWTGENQGISVANNSGKPYFEQYIPAGQVKTFGFINQQTSGSAFTSTALTASMFMFQGGDMSLTPTVGNVGIGTTSPTAKLQVVLPANTNSSIFQSTASQALLNIQTFPTTDRMQLLVGDYNGTSSPNIGAISDSDTGIQWSGNNILRFVNGGSENVTINASGNVGIGTTSPGAKLNVRGGNILIDNTTLLQWGYGDGTTYIYGDASNPTGSLKLGTANADRLTVTYAGNVGIGTTSPGYKLEVVGAVSASTYYGDGSNLTNISSGSVAAAGSDGQLQYNNNGNFGGATRLIYNDSTNRVGIGTASPGYDLDVSGSARVQDRLRVGPINSGNGVIHQSSDSVINASSATTVWSIPGSSGAVAFIEYYIINTVTGTSQRGGNIVVTWNAAGSPQIAHTETTTPDIGTTALVTFTTVITLGGDPQLIATNTSVNQFYIVLNYRYF